MSDLNDFVSQFVKCFRHLLYMETTFVVRVFLCCTLCCMQRQCSWSWSWDFDSTRWWLSNFWQEGACTGNILVVYSTLLNHKLTQVVCGWVCQLKQFKPKMMNNYCVTRRLTEICKSYPVFSLKFQTPQYIGQLTDHVNFVAKMPSGMVYSIVMVNRNDILYRICFKWTNLWIMLLRFCEWLT